MFLILVNIFYSPAYLFFGLVSSIFRIYGLDPHTISSCLLSSIVYIPVWLIILTLIYYGLHRTKLVEKQLMFVSKHRHIFLALYIFVVLWMYSIPLGCENIWEVMPEGFFMHRGVPMQFSGASYMSDVVQFPFINLFYNETPSHRVVWYIPNMLMNLAIITGMTYLTYWALKHFPVHIHRHRRRLAKKK